MKKLIALFFLGSLLGCANNESVSEKDQTEKGSSGALPIKPLIIKNGDEDGFGADIRLSIVEQSEDDSSTIFKEISIYQGKELGLIVALPKAKSGTKGFGNGIRLKSIGVASDFLLQTLAVLYKQKSDTSLRFTTSHTVTFVNLKEFAKSLNAEENADYTTSREYKLFFESENGEDYAELYLNIDPKERWIELDEKDEEYRPSLIKFLKQ